MVFIFYLFIFIICLFVYSGWGIDVQEKHRSAASHTPPTRDLTHNPGVYPAGNCTRNFLVCGPALNPLSHTSQGILFIDFFF